MCTGEIERQESRRIASEIATLNGYSASHHGSARFENRMPRHNKVPLCIPFVSDRMSAAIRQSIARAQLQNDVVLVEIPNHNMRQRLVRNRLYDRQCILSENCAVCPHGNVGDCAQMGVIYQIECRVCSSTYIGETGRILAARIKEHLANKRRGSQITALGRHRIEAHNGSDYEIKCTILAHEADIAARKALEAFWIFVRNPSMNNRNEYPSVTNELLPFVPHRGL